jgi:predicted DNA-binding ribbon-helix-helix protein
MPAHRMQITLEERQYERLRQEAERTGASIAELVRRAVDRAYGAELTVDEKLRLLDDTAGALGERQTA